ncbi:hypothetical protein AGDE_12739 [Angomonas deanei]|nr:hypothetical protein AGDE_12739 [Angomonas deanei]|eukprot:EPY23606.1 hypothetical protein AGDE_12739 [Angomonas deanei]
MVSLSPAVGSMPQQMNRSADSKTLRMTNLLKSPPEGYHPIQDTCVNTYPSNHHSCRPQPSPSHTRGLSASGSSAHSDDSPILQSPATQSLGAPSQARDSSPYSGDGYVLQLEKENKLLKDENAVLRAHLKNAERRFSTSQAQSEKEMQTLRDAVEKVKTEFEEQKMFQEEKWILKEEEYARELDLLREQRQTLKKEQEQFEREQHTLVQDLEVQLSNYQRELENKNAEIMGLETDIEQLRQNPVLCRVNGDNIDELAQLSLAEVAKTFNVGELAIDPANNTCVVDVEEYGVPLLFTVDKVTGRLYMYVTLLDFIPANTTVRCRLFETLLQASLLGKDTAGGGVGVCMSSEIILMSTSIDLRHTSPSAMAAMAIPFVQSAASWLPIVEDIASTTG